MRELYLFPGPYYFSSFDMLRVTYRSVGDKEKCSTYNHPFANVFFSGASFEVTGSGCDWKRYAKESLSFQVSGIICDFTRLTWQRANECGTSSLCSVSSSEICEMIINMPEFFPAVLTQRDSLLFDLGKSALKETKREGVTGIPHLGIQETFPQENSRKKPIKYSAGKGFYWKRNKRAKHTYTKWKTHTNAN